MEEIKNIEKGKDKNEKINCESLLKKIGFLKKEKHSLKSQLGHALKELKDQRSKLNEKNVLFVKKEKEAAKKFS